LKAKAKERKRSWVVGLSWANLVFLITVFLLGTWLAERTEWSTFLGYVPQQGYLAPLCLLILIAAMKGPKRALKLNLGVGVVFTWLLLGVNWPHRLSLADEGPRLRLMTYNVKQGTLGWNKVLKVVLEAKPDVVCFQEATQNPIPGYHLTFGGGKTIATREPVVSSERIPMTPGLTEALEVTLQSGVRIVSVQLTSFSIEDQVNRNPLALGAHMQRVAKLHRREVQMLIDRYRGKPDVVIAGDFNCPPRGQVYRQLNAAFNDAFVDSGWLTGYTYPSSFPMQRIDYAFTTNLLPQWAKTISSDASDHLPVLFEFVVNRPT